MKKKLTLLALATTLVVSTLAMTGCGSKGDGTLEGYLKATNQMEELEAEMKDLGSDEMAVDVKIKGNEMIMTFDMDVEAMAGQELSDDDMAKFEEAFVKEADANFDAVADEAFAEIEKGIEEEGADIKGTLKITIKVNNKNTGKEIWSGSFENK